MKMLSKHVCLLRGGVDNMRKIQKAKSPEEFENCKNAFRASNGRELTYGEFIGISKQNLKINLLMEQYALCCYCMKRIEWYNSHIEHFVPQTLDCSLQMDYGNMLASCNGFKEKRENCGHTKGNWYDSTLLISPLSDECEKIFSYSPDGRILSKDCRGIETIKHLDLNNDLLKRARKSAIFVSGLFDPDLNDEIRKDLIKEYNTPKNNELIAFCNAITYCLENF